MDPELVPGVLISNEKIGGLSSLSYGDIPELAVGQALTDEATPPAKPPEFSDEDQEIIEERLRDLGYL